MPTKYDVDLTLGKDPKNNEEKQKMAKMKTTTILLAAVVLIGAYFLFVADTTPKPAPVVPGDGVIDADSVSFIPQMTRLGRAGTSLSTAANNYFVLTDNIGEVAGNAELSVPTVYDMKVMFGENSTAYYTRVEDVAVRGANPTRFPVQLAMAATSLSTLYARNSDGSVNGVSSAQSMGTDETFGTTITFRSGSDLYFGSPYSTCRNVAVIEYDKTYVRQVIGNSPAAVPGFFTYTNSSYDGSQAFFIPKSEGNEVSFDLELVSSASNAPDGTNNPIVHLFDCNIDKNERTLELIHGVEDEDLNMLSLANQTRMIYLE